MLETEKKELAAGAEHASELWADHLKGRTSHFAIGMVGGLIAMICKQADLKGIVIEPDEVAMLACDVATSVSVQVEQ
jgi:hypothetical protein